MNPTGQRARSDDAGRQRRTVPSCARLRRYGTRAATAEPAARKGVGCACAAAAPTWRSAFAPCCTQVAGKGYEEIGPTLIINLNDDLGGYGTVGAR